MDTNYFNPKGTNGLPVMCGVPLHGTPTTTQVSSAASRPNTSLNFVCLPTHFLMKGLSKLIYRVFLERSTRIVRSVLSMLDDENLRAELYDLLGGAEAVRFAA